MEALLSDPRFSTRKLSLEPGDAVLFHCNLVHRSLPNDSDSPRYRRGLSYHLQRLTMTGSNHQHQPAPRSHLG